MRNGKSKSMRWALLTASLAFIAVLVAVAVLTLDMGQGSAHGPDDADAHDCSDKQGLAAGLHDALSSPDHPKCAGSGSGQDPTSTPTPTPTETPTPTPTPTPTVTRTSTPTPAPSGTPTSTPTATPTPAPSGTTTPTPTRTETPTPTPAPTNVVASGWNPSPGESGNIAIRVEYPDDQTLYIDDSIVLVLPNEFSVPESIGSGGAYFRQDGEPSGGQRMQARVSVDKKDDSDPDVVTGEDSYAIRIYVPDMDPSDEEVANLTGPFDVVITKDARILNPTESGSYPVGYQILRRTDVYDPGNTKKFVFDRPGDSSSTVLIRAEAKLSDHDNKRGYELEISGSGFTSGVNARAYVLKNVESGRPDCNHVVDNGKEIGSAMVNETHGVIITAEVRGGAGGAFSPGETNYVCIRDDNAPKEEQRLSFWAQYFDLQHSISVKPSTVVSGEEVQILLNDYPSNAKVTRVSIAGAKKWTNDGVANDDFSVTVSGDKLTFEMPGGMSGSVAVAVVVDGVPAEDASKSTNILVNPSGLSLSQSEVGANAAIIISGDGFTRKSGSMIAVENVTIDDQQMVVDEAGIVSCSTDISDSGQCVKVTSSGEFAANVRVWTVSGASRNPALTHGQYTIKVKDSSGYEGTASITVKEPTVKVSPETVSAWDYIEVSGENWPVSSPDVAHAVSIEVDGRSRSVDVDSTGRFRHEYKLRAGIAIGREHKVKVKYEEDKRREIEKQATFNVSNADITITPPSAAPGQTITVEIGGMRLYSIVEEITIGRVNIVGNRSVTTNREGDATVEGLVVPYMDPGHYPVTVVVGTDTRVAQFEMLPEVEPVGVATDLPEAVASIGDNLDAIFHFSNATKQWTFFDPRPDFAEFSTLHELVDGQPYWVEVKETQMDVDWNGRVVNFTCAQGDCSSLEIW